MIQRTLTGTNKKRKKRSGFRSRMQSNTGKKVINSRRRKKRYYLVK